MDTEWIDTVMRMNASIVATEARFNEQVVSLVTLAGQGENTTEAEGLLASYRRRLVLLRTIQAQLLKGVVD